MGLFGLTQASPFIAGPMWASNGGDLAQRTAGDHGGPRHGTSLFNGVKAKRLGKLKGADSKSVSAEQMEISRLRAELARLKLERDILGKATAACGVF